MSLAKLGIERAERLVHQKSLRPAHDGAAERDALPVAAGKPPTPAVEQMLDPQQPRGLVDAAFLISLASIPWHRSGKPMFWRTFMCG